MSQQVTPSSVQLPLNDLHGQQLAEIFKLLGDLGRLKMVLACLEQPRAVSELADCATLSQSLASHHLRYLREAHILKARREGKQVLYELDDEHIRCVLTDMVDHVQEPH